MCWAMEDEKVVSRGLSGLLWPTPYHSPQQPCLPSARPQVKQSVLPKIALHQDGLEPLGSSCAPALVFHVAGTTETHHCIWLLFFSGIYQLRPFRVS